MMSEEQNLRILVVDDERAIRSFLRTSLSSYGYYIFEATNGKEALDKMLQVRPDIVILDLGLPDIDGIKVITRLRKHSQIPIVILSIRDEPSEKIAALDAGADDYLTKPFTTGELLARLRAVMRRFLPLDNKEPLKIGEVSIDLTKRCVMVGNNEIRLSPTEYDILKLFIINAGKVITHRQLLREIWNKNEDYEGILHLLRVTISNLRNKIEPNPNRPTYILTEPGVGYRLISEE